MIGRPKATAEVSLSAKSVSIAGATDWFTYLSKFVSLFFEKRLYSFRERGNIWRYTNKKIARKVKQCEINSE